jgi:hypothetical protein
VFVTATPSTTGGWSKIKYAAQTTTVQTPKGTAGSFGGYYIYNPNATVAYVQVFDAATATTITLGTTVPDMIFAIPATSAANIELTNGVNMTNGIKLACTTTATGLTAPGTGLDMTVRPGGGHGTVHVRGRYRRSDFDDDGRCRGEHGRDVHVD